MFNPQSLNPYSYVQNDPLIYRDPSGHNPVAICKALAWAGRKVAGWIGGKLGKEIGDLLGLFNTELVSEEEEKKALENVGTPTKEKKGTVATADPNKKSPKKAEVEDEPTQPSEPQESKDNTTQDENGGDGDQSVVDKETSPDDSDDED